MRKLDNSMRSRIAERATGVAFAERHEELIKRDNDLAERVRNYLLPKDHIAIIDALPRKYFGPIDYGSQINVADPQGVFVGVVKAHRDLRVPSFLKGNEAHIVEDISIIDDIKALLSDISDWKNERNKFSQKINGVLASYGSTKLLLEDWPTLLELMGEEYFSPKPKSKSMALANSVNELDVILQNSKPFEEVAA